MQLSCALIRRSAAAKRAIARFVAVMGDSASQLREYCICIDAPDEIRHFAFSNFHILDIALAIGGGGGDPTSFQCCPRVERRIIGTICKWQKYTVHFRCLMENCLN